MSYQRLDERKAGEALRLFNEATLRGEQYYRPLDESGFVSLLLTPVKQGDEVFAFCEIENEVMNGFIIGHFDSGIKRYFLTMIEVEPSMRRKGIGRGLLNCLQEQMEQDSFERGLKLEMEVSYFNPVMLSWDLPETDHHFHNNAQGVLLGSPAHLFLKNNGFRDFDCQNSYHQCFADYKWPEEAMAVYEKRMVDRGLTIEFYDPARHTDFDDLVKDLNNDLWNWQIPAELARKGGPRPMLIVNDHGRVGGFAGPIVVEPSGRAWLLGLAVHSRCRGCGCASVLFNRMCEEFRLAGAEYMTFFTAEGNFARNIYEGAGFRIHASWANARRLVVRS